MSFVPGITRYQLNKWMAELSAKITAGSLKGSIHSTTTNWDANTAAGSPQVYGTTGELSASGTGYTTGGYVLDEPVLAASGNAIILQFSNVGGAAGTMVLGAGTIPTGTYCLCIYDTTDSNRLLAILTGTISVASSGGAMTFTVPANALSIT